eukprot:1723905-Rhodomonas_salina.2
MIRGWSADDEVAWMGGWMAGDGADGRVLTWSGLQSWGQMEGGGVEPEHVQIMGMLEQAKDDDQG